MGLNKRLIGAGAVGSGALTPSENFKVVTYTGNGGTQSITGVGFQPDFVWCKARSQAHDHNATDSTRGVSKGLNPNTTAVEGNQAPLGVTAFGTDGFTVVDNSGGGASVNGSGITYVAWCWKAGGGTTSSNTDGSITSTVQANTDAGFSIIKYTGTGSNASIGHNLGVAPEIIFIKKTSGSSDWVVGALEWTKYLELNGTPGFRTANVWQNTAPTSSVFTLTSGGDVNGSGSDYIAYAFASIDGFSKIGSYTGNGSTNGPIVETGFEPAFLMIKRTDTADAWYMYDNKRTPSNPRNKIQLANTNDAELTNTQYYSINFLSNGFQLKSDVSTATNDNGGSYIYMAFAADPDTEAPTLASSFNIETYTGNGSTQSISGLGFSPSFVWIKPRSFVDNHVLSNIVSGVNKSLATNTTAAEQTTLGVSSFDSDGFSLPQWGNVTDSGEDFVAWSWKANDNEPTILPNTELTSLISKYKFNDNVDDDYGDNNASPSNLSFVSGRFKKAADFNGSSSKITYPQVAPFNDSNGIIAISAWVKLDSASDEFVLMSASSTSDQNVSLGLIVGGNKAGRVFISNAANNQQELQANFGSTNNTNWNHYVWQLSSSNGIELWFNGVSQTRTQTSQAGSITTGSWFGDLTYPTDVNYATGINRVVTTAYYEGEVDQMRLFNAELTSSEISALYNEANEAIVSANANAGFSIVKYEGTGVAMSVPHGLSAAPTFIIVKNLTSSSAWAVFHTTLGATKYLALNETTAVATASNVWNDTAPTATTISVGTWGPVNTSANQHIAYCFHDVTGYQKFGSYTGDGNNDRAITTGFKPDFVMIKSTVGADNWRVYDTRRGITGGGYLEPNRSDADDTSNAPNLIMTSTGFTITSGGVTVGNNANGNLYIYWAIAKNVPSNTTLANSFKAVTYTGNGGTQSITGTGFTPDLVWIKHRNEANDHVLTDSIRGVDNILYSNSPDAQPSGGQITSFDTDGFSLKYSGGQNVKFNKSGGTYVAWCWKAGNTWQSNVTGAIPSTVNANTANGFSIVKYTGTGANTTVGHSLGAAPEVMLIKDLDNSRDWGVYHIGNTGSSGYANQERLKLNTDDPTTTYAPYWNGTTPTSTVFSLGNEGNVNTSGQEYIAYCWTPKSGYSKFGSYTGTGSSGNAQDIGFQPDFVMIKSTAQYGWNIYDSKRPSGSITGRYMLIANANDTEYTTSAVHIDLTSTGFSFPNGYDGTNKSSQKYVYMAFKMN